jgi:hypothetical protein
MAQRRSVSKKKAAPTRGTAPSAANIREIEHYEPSEKAKAATPSEVDAMGKDKRRNVIGQSYGPSKRSQFTVLASVLATFAIIIVGFSMLAKHSDAHPGTHPPAPWAQPNAPQIPPIRPQ